MNFTLGPPSSHRYIGILSYTFYYNFCTVGARDTKFCRGIHRGITLTILSAQGGGLGPLLSPLIVLFCCLFPGGVRILVKSTWQDRVAWKFFFRLTPNSPCFRQLKRFTAQSRYIEYSSLYREHLHHRKRAPYASLLNRSVTVYAYTRSLDAV